MIEQRKFVRINEAIKIGYRVIGPVDIRKIQLSENISGAGVRLPTDHRMPKGTILDLAIYITEYTEPIPVTGEVAWLADRKNARFPYMAGIKFIKINPSDQEKISGFIRKRFPVNDSSEINWID